MMEIRRFFKKYIPVSFCVCIAVAALSLVCYLFSIKNAVVADLLDGSVGTAVRFVLAKLSGWLPFSLFELLVICALPLAVTLIVLLVRTRKTAAQRVRSILSFLSVISLVFSSYVFTLGIGYRTTPLSEKIGVEDVRNIEKEELFSVANTLISEVNALSEKLTHEDGVSVMPYTLGEMCDRLSLAYKSVATEYSALTAFDGRVKPVLFSTVMSDAGITGIYSFFTGEANVNVEYPHYTLPFTAAHEMAHQRGVARENEANFVAFLVCIASDDDYIRYSGYLGILEYFLSALYATDREAYPAILASISPAALDDIRASNAVYLAHKDSLIGRINEKLNDRYLKFNGTAGVISYGYVVRLTVGYYRITQ